jgi:hypothetical protein
VPLEEQDNKFYEKHINYEQHLALFIINRFIMQQINRSAINLHKSVETIEPLFILQPDSDYRYSIQSS